MRVVPGEIRGMIGEPISYIDRNNQGHFSQESLIEAFERMDISIPYKFAQVQPMDIDEECGGIGELKLNQRDKRLFEVDNPEDGVPNPFAPGFTDIGNHGA